jgi:hypothetical protein
MTIIGKESMPIEIMVLQASGIVIETLLFVAKEVPIIKSFAHILQGTLKVIRQAIINEESIITLHDFTVEMSNDLLRHFIKQAQNPKFKNAVQRFTQTLHQISKFISAYKNSFVKKILGAKDSKLVKTIESYLQKLRDDESRMQTLYSIEVDEKIDQQGMKIDEILALLTITTNNTVGSPIVNEGTTNTTDGSPNLSGGTGNTNGEDNTEVYDVNLTVDGADNEIIEEDNEYLEKDTEIIEKDNETNEVDDEENCGVTLDQMLSIKTATRFDTNG